MELPIMVSVSTVRERLLIGLQSINIKTENHVDDSIEFWVSIIDATTRGFRLQGISSGKINLSNMNNRCVLRYQIITMPMRIFSIIFPIVAILSLIILFIIQIQETSICSTMIGMVGALILSIIGFTVGKIIVRYKFESFIRSVV